MHYPRRVLWYVPLVIAVVALPTAVMLGWYQWTRDPNLRPLGITREALVAYGDESTGVDLVVHINWPSDQMAHPGRERLGESIRVSFAAKGVDALLQYYPSTGPPEVIYQIGRSSMGPFTSAEAAHGITAAVEAFRMH